MICFGRKRGGSVDMNGERIAGVTFLPTNADCNSLCAFFATLIRMDLADLPSRGFSGQLSFSFFFPLH
jgi:hypothetical protein